jgi:hypothetical protein
MTTNDEVKENLNRGDAVKAMGQPQLPSIGRMVHYQSYGTPGGEYLPAPRSAIITSAKIYNVSEGSGTDLMTVDLCVFNPTGLFFNQRVKYADKPTPGHWNWPPRV